MTSAQKSKSSEISRKIDEYLEYLEVERGSSPLTIRNYRHYLFRFSDWLKTNFAQIRPGSLNLEIIRKYRVHLARYKGQNGKSLLPITQSYHVIALRSLLRWLNKNDYKTLSPEKVDLPKAESRSIKFLNNEQVERFMSQPLPSKTSGLRDRAMLELFLSVGNLE